VVVAPDVAQAIAHFAREQRSDLVVLGTRGLGLDATGRLGSVSAAVAERLETPILLVPPAVWADYAKEP
jgi:nucleotide-binding universal stress UspA family protein